MSSKKISLRNDEIFLTMESTHVIVYDKVKITILDSECIVTCN